MDGCPHYIPEGPPVLNQAHDRLKMEKPPATCLRAAEREMLPRAGGEFQHETNPDKDTTSSLSDCGLILPGLHGQRGNFLYLNLYPDAFSKKKGLRLFIVSP